jgi:hypothetical protein
MIKKINRLTDVMCLLLQARPRPCRVVSVVKSNILFFIFIIILGFYYEDFIVLIYLVLYDDFIVTLLLYFIMIKFYIMNLFGTIFLI